MRHVAVIGGGASGMMAAITAASNHAEVTLIEHNDRVGKKILSTGNGRCNFTNMVQEPICYHSEDPSFPWKIIEQFPAQETIRFFLQLGVYSKNRNGYLYPNSDQASSVLDALRMEMKRLHIQILTDTECSEILPEKNHFLLKTTQGSLHADTVILAAGSKAAPVTGSDGSGYALAKQLGHHILPVLPALVQLRCKENFYKSVSGVRIQGKVAIYADRQCLAEDCGEIQLTNYGISGIPVFQVSRYASKALYEKRQVKAVLNFMPDFEEIQFLTFLKNRIAARPDKTLDEFFIGLFHKKLSDLWIRLSGIERKKQVHRLTEEELFKMIHLIQKFETQIIASNSFEQAQVCCGGIDTREVNPDTLESLYIPGLYFAGEILDVDGLCGGYNLQWAWSSGYVTGKEAADASN